MDIQSFYDFQNNQNISFEQYFLSKRGILSLVAGWFVVKTIGVAGFVGKVCGVVGTSFATYYFAPVKVASFYRSGRWWNVLRQRIYYALLV